MIPPADHERETLPPSAETHIPGPARLPSFSVTERIDPIKDLAERVGDLSDALHASDGPVHLLIAGLAEKGAKREQRAQRRHRQVMRTLSHIATELVALNQTVSKLVPEQARHAALLKLVAPAGAAE